ncbi:V-type ATP synthase subunit F [Peptoniphilus sp. KCTC 25270]|uniref:V-type ATP synthase subunit F n=1 Tax=Peptoniphilus sp. KCTC 25270 TaxID=2897414 RepID=UPI001E62EC23|nr:V-type ATP synthase subunit F [Peptoniphilus sp. KCTC 25270]MCD1147792.1 V-type ATP synthase subunit F [Peptoniphilus sp. KCTC 25270]
MRSLVLSCDDELLIALRMSGFEGKFCRDEEELRANFLEGVKNKEIGIILLGEEDFTKLREEILKVKSKPRSPLIVTVPGREGFKEKDFIMKYVREAIGLKLDR